MHKQIIIFIFYTLDEILKFILFIHKLLFEMPISVSIASNMYSNFLAVVFNFHMICLILFLFIFISFSSLFTNCLLHRSHLFFQ